MNKISLLALGLVVAMPFAASAADGLSYNYVEGGYVNTDARGGDADGWGVKGSVAVHPNFHIFGDYTAQETERSNADVDQWRLGVGYNYGIAPTTDLVARVAYQKFDPKRGLDFNGYSTEVGVRTAFTPMIEGYALAGYEDFSEKHGINPDGEFYGRVGATAKFNQNWGLSGEVKLAKAGDREWFVGPRFTW
ncbi:Ax21 family protein [Stenotrophomonas sp. Betaine-02u-21]|jgi:Ax21 family sulfation-dependent quorum factor|uniref:OmpO family porin n=1 Tax=unclassified Stenotrophomonas TaxID=196198 RepID=UPI0005AF2EF1|nr:MULTISPECIES: Ax21 family protein [unclassified Stenotrophomonas]KIP82595.1 hypothetical protein SN15_14125 [Stenotrophomonas maltophilia]PKH74062.1 Ax21 family protein [Stenotrophomonas sp. Betaine-02u-21]PKH76514.1 Ax21 family protein [Stenotrophomonas sp. Betaine-02u-23]PKH94260.1 Ax21 family protein [Stenotrophomonas sp. Bg11-02]